MLRKPKACQALALQTRPCLGSSSDLGLVKRCGVFSGEAFIGRDNNGTCDAVQMLGRDVREGGVHRASLPKSLIRRQSFVGGGIHHLELRLKSAATKPYRAFTQLNG